MRLPSLLCMVLCSFAAAEFNAFEENLLFKVHWPGPMTDLLSAKQDENSVVMTTVENEQYKCILPDTTASNEENAETYTGPSALELLRPLMAKDSCIYKLDLYWAYELCHGSHLKQFHEEKEAGKPVSLQEFYLGQYDTKQFDKDVEYFKQAATTGNVQRIKMEGIYYPYVTINMTDGTLCDLSGKQRVTRIKYICYPEMRHQIYSLEETVTCEYEVLVVTYLLCKHPDYSMKAPVTNEIRCHALEDTPLRPIVLEELEQESNELNPEDDKWELFKNQFAVKDEPAPTPSSAERKNAPPVEIVTPYDSKLVSDFISGEHCLHGGSGWWKYEFCYGRSVEQYHQEPGGSKTVIVLGTWNKESHLEWLKKNPHKRPKLSLDRNQVSHFFSNGDQCGDNATYRHVEVRLKCKESSNHPNAVTMVLLEPSTCEYILLVESPIMCSLLPRADENGLIEIAAVSED